MPHTICVLQLMAGRVISFIFARVPLLLVDNLRHIKLKLTCMHKVCCVEPLVDEMHYHYHQPTSIKGSLVFCLMCTPQENCHTLYHNG